MNEPIWFTWQDIKVVKLSPPKSPIQSWSAPDVRQPPQSVEFGWWSGFKWKIFQAGRSHSGAAQGFFFFAGSAFLCVHLGAGMEQELFPQDLSLSNLLDFKIKILVFVEVLVVAAYFWNWGFWGVEFSFPCFVLQSLQFQEVTMQN